MRLEGNEEENKLILKGMPKKEDAKEIKALEHRKFSVMCREYLIKRI